MSGALQASAGLSTQQRLGLQCELGDVAKQELELRAKQGPSHKPLGITKRQLSDAIASVLSPKRPKS